MKWDRAQGATDVPATALPSPDLAVISHVEFRPEGSRKPIAVWCKGWRIVDFKDGVPVCAGCGESLADRLKAAA